VTKRKHLLKKELEKKIEKHIYDKLEKGKYQIDILDPNEFLKHNTFDLSFKLFYLYYREININLAREVYFSHIKAYNFFKIKEYGNPHKDSLEIFEKSFIETYESIKKNNFDSKLSLIPLSKKGDYLNGSHRISISAFLNKKIYCLKTKINLNTSSDYSFFYKKAVPVNIIEKALKKYLDYIEGVHIAFIWPAAKGRISEIKNLITNRIYYKEVLLNSTGGHNLLAEIYKEQKWVGNAKNNYKGTIGKLKECFKNFNLPIRVIVFQEKNLSKVIKLKKQIREIFKIGKHSIHITDNRKEVLDISKIIFNKNGIHFLNNARPYRYNKTEQKIIDFKNYLEKKKINKKNIVISGSFVMEIYGLRQARDVDFLNINSQLNQRNDIMMKYYKANKTDLVFNENYFFEFNELKFISFDQTFKMKTLRNEKKDIRDLAIMKSFFENDFISLKIIRFKQYLYFTGVFFKVKIIEFLKLLGIHSYVKLTYNFLIKLYKKI
jgi:hypothetical protein